MLLESFSRSAARDASSARVPAPAASLENDAALEVNESSAEGFVGLEQIWGKPYAIKGVKLERFDLSPDGNDESAATQPR